MTTHLETLTRPALTLAPPGAVMSIAPARRRGKKRRKQLILRPTITFAQIETAVTTFTGVTHEELHSRSRVARICDARRAAIWLMTEFTAESNSAIARHFGQDHSAVTYALRYIADAAECYPASVADLRELRHRVSSANCPAQKSRPAAPHDYTKDGQRGRWDGQT